MPVPPPSPSPGKKAVCPHTLYFTSTFATLVYKRGSGCCCLRTKVRVGRMRSHVLKAHVACHGPTSLTSMTFSCMTFGRTLIGWRVLDIVAPCWGIGLARVHARSPTAMRSVIPDLPGCGPRAAMQPLNPPTHREKCPGRMNS